MADLRNKVFYEDIFSATFNGMSRFLGPAKLALVVSNKETKQSYAVDPGGMLASFGIDSGMMHDYLFETSKLQVGSPLLNDKLLISRDTSSISPTATWILERSPTVRHAGIVGQWLTEASTLARVAASARPIRPELHRSICDTLLSFASSAVKRAVQTHTKAYQLINPIDVILNLTLAYEEGKKCSGGVTFCSDSQLPISALCVALNEASQPSLTSTKHLRKMMMSVENSRFSILCDSKRMVGIVDKCSEDQIVQNLLRTSIEAVLTRGNAEIIVNSNYLCSAYEGQLFSRALGPSEVAIEHLLETGSILRPEEVHRLAKLLARFVEYIQQAASGCSLVVDAGPGGVRLAGEYLEFPLDLSANDGIDIALRMAKIDGALHINTEGQLLAFGCLLDGQRCINEDRARGARYNSAIRFTHDHPESFVVTVSSDGPLSCFYGGRDLTNRKPLIMAEAKLLLLPSL